MAVSFPAEAGIALKLFLNFEQKWASCSIVLTKKCSVLRKLTESSVLLINATMQAFSLSAVSSFVSALQYENKTIYGLH